MLFIYLYFLEKNIKEGDFMSYIENGENASSIREKINNICNKVLKTIDKIDISMSSFLTFTTAEVQSEQLDLAFGKYNENDIYGLGKALKLYAHSKGVNSDFINLSLCDTLLEIKNNQEALQELENCEILFNLIKNSNYAYDTLYLELSMWDWKSDNNDLSFFTQLKGSGCESLSIGIQDDKSIKIAVTGNNIAKDFYLYWNSPIDNSDGHIKTIKMNLYCSYSYADDYGYYGIKYPDNQINVRGTDKIHYLDVSNEPILQPYLLSDPAMKYTNTMILRELKLYRK